ncbi:RTA1 like protein [Cryphonectria parasitica EP155]|uniref:RTA1 like protein n=1 Tax=Cryphonectria parasitica (strain ATCC 38755 / EP155) TaxID=660469 RepID=A0A9P5CN83_CRYP1|nr:RTA1 like protein [Cryphonectria parasitica EP155]KAF3763866.1 RTA1 like protein [Cryphonectria parasitica EP155]
MAVTDFVFYHYTPSMAAAIVMCVVFFIVAALQIWFLLRHRTWYFAPFVIGCLFEGVGYIGRILSSTEAPNYTKTPYIIQSLLLLLGPTFFAASIYMVLGRIITLLHGEQFSMVPPKWLTKVFVMGDVLSFFIQSGGGAMLSNAKSESKIKTGNWIIVAGLGVQIVFFGLFVIVALLFHIRIRKYPTMRAKTTSAPWQALLYVLYASSCLILIRSIYRVAEYITGSNGVIQDKEWWLYVFDAVPMVLVTILFCGFHPSREVGSEAHLDV